MSDAPDQGEIEVCERHGLTLTPEGRCVMCGLDSVVVPEPSRGPTLLFVGFVVVLLGMLGIAGAMWMGERQEPRAEPTPQAEPPQSPRVERPRARGQERPKMAIELPTPVEKAVPLTVSPVRPPVPPVPDPVEAPLAETAAPARQAPRAPDKYELAAARRRVDVKMYATSWCGVCSKARAYMTRNKISFTEYDVEQNVSASRRHKLLNPKGSVPTFDIDGDVMVGFNARGLESKINKAAHSHL